VKFKKIEINKLTQQLNTI